MQTLGELSGVVLKVTTKMVLVDAVVTTQNGKPVPGLKAEDFEVLEDGRRQEIKAFGARVPPAQGAAAPPHHKLAPALFSNTMDFHPEEGAPVIVLLDSLNTPWADRVYGEQQLLEYLSKNAPRRNVAFYALGHRLHLLQDFTDDFSVLRQAMSGSPAQSHSDYAYPEQQGTSSEPQNLSPSAPTLTGNPAQSIQALKAQLAEAEKTITIADRDRAIAITLEAFRTIARHAVALPGRKQLLWLSAGFPLNFEALKETPYFQEFQETANLLTDAQVAVYPIDIRGLVAFFPNEMTSGMAQLTANHIAMNYVASRTGGLAWYGRNDVDSAIGIALDDGSTYYVLGYYPKNKNWNGEFRNIKVKVRQQGLKVRCRTGYLATDPTKKNENQAKQARSEFVRSLAPDSGAAGMLPFFAQVIAPDHEHLQVFVEVRVDPYSVLFVAQPNGDQQAELEFATVVLDAKDKLVTSKFDTLNANLTSATFVEVMKTSLAVRQKLDLPPGSYKLRVGVRDVKSNLIGTLTAHVDVALQGPQ